MPRPARTPHARYLASLDRVSRAADLPRTDPERRRAQAAYGAAYRGLFHAGCASGWRADQEAGVIYPPVLTCPADHAHTSAAGCLTRWFAYHAAHGLCPYCATPLAPAAQPQEAAA